MTPAAKKISVLDKPPESESNDIYDITSGSFEHQEGEWKTTSKLKGDLCIYEASHPSGHFKKIVWKGVGLVEYASGNGAHADWISAETHYAETRVVNQDDLPKS
jgi:hypothetical protein